MIEPLKICPIEAELFSKCDGNLYRRYPCGIICKEKEYYECKDYSKCPWYITYIFKNTPRVKDIENSNFFKKLSKVIQEENLENKIK